MDAVQTRKLESHVDWKLLRCWVHRAAISSLKSIWRSTTSDHPQGLTMGLILFNVFTNDLGSGQSSQEVFTQYRTGRVADTAHGLAAIRGTIRDTSTGWGNEMTRNSASSPKGNVKSSTWEGIKSCLWWHWELYGKQFRRDQLAIVLSVQRPTAYRTPLSYIRDISLISSGETHIWGPGSSSGLATMEKPWVCQKKST